MDAVLFFQVGHLSGQILTGHGRQQDEKWVQQVRHWAIVALGRGAGESQRIRVFLPRWNPCDFLIPWSPAPERSLFGDRVPDLTITAGFSLLNARSPSPRNNLQNGLRSQNC